MSRTAITVGPQDHGRRMSLDEFESAEAQEGHLYELSRGSVAVVEVPRPRHFAQVNALRRQLSGYDLAHPGLIHGIAGGSDCRIIIAGLNSERHPDVAVYKTAPPEEDVWATWVPELIIEVVSPSSVDRDYVEKPEEYLRFGVAEYWIVDADRGEMLVHRRRGGQWADRVVRPGEVYRTRLLPGFELNLAAVFDAANAITP